MKFVGDPFSDPIAAAFAGDGQGLQFGYETLDAV
jgi:hypothetical protein